MMVYISDFQSVDNGIHWASTLPRPHIDWNWKTFSWLVFYFSWTTFLKFTLITFLRSHVKTRKIYNQAICLCAFQKWGKCQKCSWKREKYISRPHASVHFKNGLNAKNGYETNKCHKCSWKREKYITGPHASVHFENGPNTVKKHWIR